MKLDKQKFIRCLGKAFPTKLVSKATAALEDLVRYIEDDPETGPIEWVAYELATAWHETGFTMLPIHERGPRWYFNKYDPVKAKLRSRRKRALAMGNTLEGDGYRYRGRGFVQLTWKTNYRKAAKELGVDLIEDPDLALQPEIAYRIMARGMRHGWFTGRGLGRFLGDGKRNYVEARTIINGHDKAQTIAIYATKFEGCLRSALITNP